MTYDEIIQEAGKRIEKEVYYINDGVRTDVDIDNIESVKLSFNAPLLGTLMQGAELVLKEPISGEIYIKINARFESYTANKIYGPYFLKKEPTYQADDKTYLHILYDAIIKSMVDYEPLNIQYPCTVFDFFTELVSASGYTTNIESLPNGTNIITSDKYNNIGYTYRDVLDDIAMANGILLYADENELKQAVISNNNPIVIDDDVLKNQNIEFGQHFGPINTIVLSRAVSDNIMVDDPTSVAQYGNQEYKISDNQLMSDNDRSDYIDAILTQLNGIEYDIYDTELTGYGSIAPLQKVQFETGDNTYSSYVFNNEILITGGYKQTIYTEIPEEANTNYSVTDKTDKRANQTTIIVDKVNKKITSVVSDVNDLETRMVQVEETADSFNIEVVNQQIQNATNPLQEQIDSNTSTISENSSNIETMQGQISEMNFNFSTAGLNIGSLGDDISSTLNNQGLKIYNLGTLIAIFNKNGAGVNKLIATETIQLQNLLLKKREITWTNPFTSSSETIDVVSGFWLKDLIEDLEDLEV